MLIRDSRVMANDLNITNADHVLFQSVPVDQSTIDLGNPQSNLPRQQDASSRPEYL